MSKRHVPERSCIICGAKSPKPELVRVVLSLEGECAVDESGKRVGRGAYLCHRAACWERAVKGERLARSLRGPVRDADKQRLADYGAGLSQTSEPVA